MTGQYDSDIIYLQARIDLAMVHSDQASSSPHKGSVLSGRCRFQLSLSDSEPTRSLGAFQSRASSSLTGEWQRRDVGHGTHSPVCSIFQHVRRFLCPLARDAWLFSTVECERAADQLMTSLDTLVTVFFSSRTAHCTKDLYSVCKSRYGRCTPGPGYSTWLLPQPPHPESLSLRDGTKAH